MQRGAVRRRRDVHPPRAVLRGRPSRARVSAVPILRRRCRLRTHNSSSATTSVPATSTDVAAPTGSPPSRATQRRTPWSGPSRRASSSEPSRSAGSSNQPSPTNTSVWATRPTSSSTSRTSTPGGASPPGTTSRPTISWALRSGRQPRSVNAMTWSGYAGDVRTADAGTPATCASRASSAAGSSSASGVSTAPFSVFDPMPVRTANDPPGPASTGYPAPATSRSHAAWITIPTSSTRRLCATARQRPRWPSNEDRRHSDLAPAHPDIAGRSGEPGPRVA